MVQQHPLAQRLPSNIRAIKIGTKTMYRRAEIDALMLENSHLG